MTGVLRICALAALLAAPASAAPRREKCESPRAAVESLLAGLRESAPDHRVAAACFDMAQLERPAVEGPDLAAKLKDVLDGRGLWIVLDDVPTDAEFKDGNGVNRWELFPDRISGVAWERSKAGRWLLTASSLAALPELYAQTFPLDTEALVQRLPRWVRTPVLGVELWKLFGILLLIVLALAVRRVVVYAMTRYVRGVLRRLGLDWTGEAVERAARPIGALTFAGLFALGFPLLHFSVRANRTAIVGAQVLAAFGAVWLGFRIADIVAQAMRDRADKAGSKLGRDFGPFVRKTFKVLVSVVGFVVMLRSLDVDVASLLTGLGIGGLAVALAAKDSVANFFGSLMIFIDKPFQIGDWVRVGGDIDGTVEDVGFRSTRIRTAATSILSVPNARLADSVIDNLGARAHRRYKATLPVAYGTSVAQVEAFCDDLRKVLAERDGIRKEACYVELHSLAPTSLELLVDCLLDATTYAAELQTRTALNLEVLRLAEQHGVHFAPQVAPAPRPPC